MGKYSVLLVDDDEKIVQLLKVYFEQDGFIAYTAYNGVQSMQFFREKKPSIIILV